MDWKLGRLITGVMLASCILAGCASAANWGKDDYDSYIAGLPPEGDKPTEEEAKAVAMAYFNGALKDPYSAIFEWGPIDRGVFRGDFERWGTPGWIMRVGVNAKNSYGGYTGMKPYNIVIRSGHIVEVYYLDSRSNSWVSTIGIQGAPIPPPAK